MIISFGEGVIDDVIEIDAEIPEFVPKNSKSKIRQRLEGRLYYLLLASVGEEKVGYKLGYQISETGFYSWCGAVHPDYRGNGIAKSLLKRQESWALNQGFQSIHVRSMNRFPSMLQLLISNGYQICDYKNSGDPERSKICFVKRLGKTP